MTGGQPERRSRRGQVLPEAEKVLLVCHEGTELELGEDECISPASDGMDWKWNRQSDYLRSEGNGTPCG
jgi:hypothetical protein